MIYYRKNRKGESGILDASSFFKRTKLDSDFKEFWISSGNAKRARKFDRLIEKFFEWVFSQV